MKYIYLIINLFIFSINNVACLDFRVDPLVLIDQGLVRGEKASDGDYSQFLGIPYANVDLDNPFGPSLPHPGFGGEIFHASDNSLKCPQLARVNLYLNVDQDMQCLKLNVYVPSKASVSNLLPVMVFIHGGGFDEGFSDEYGIPNIVNDGVVVVTMNYRLGVYGFLCLDSPLAPGNQGLKDQLEALRWVKNNINAFGGNPNDVTLAGLSAGSISVMLHLFSPKEKLYHKIFAMSGVPLTDGMFFEGDPNGATKLAEFLGYSTNSTDQAITFLSSTPHNLITAAAKDMGLVTVPCKEKSFDGIEKFLDSDPYTMANTIKLKNIPILIGNTEHERNYNLFSSSDSNIFYNRLVQNFNLDENQLATAEKITRNFYVGDEAVTSDVIQFIDNFKSDVAFNYPIQKTITKLLNEGAGSIFFYVFSYTQADYATHATEVKYLFNNKWDNDEQRLVSERFTSLLANFVKNGNPTPEVTDLVPFTWTPVTSEKRPYFVIDTEVRMDSRFLQERMAFWDIFYVAYEKYNKYNAI